MVAVALIFSLSSLHLLRGSIVPIVGYWRAGTVDRRNEFGDEGIALAAGGAAYLRGRVAGVGSEHLAGEIERAANQDSRSRCAG
jgi:hypothetical protein